MPGSLTLLADEVHCIVTESLVKEQLVPCQITWIYHWAGLVCFLGDNLFQTMPWLHGCGQKPVCHSLWPSHCRPRAVPSINL